MLKDLLRMILRFVKATAAPKMLSRFLLIQTRQVTDYEKEQQKKKYIKFIKWNPFTKHFYRNKYAQQSYNQSNNDLWYSQIHAINLEHEDNLTDIQTVISQDYQDHIQDFDNENFRNYVNGHIHFVQMQQFGNKGIRVIHKLYDLLKEIFICYIYYKNQCVVEIQQLGKCVIGVEDFLDLKVFLIAKNQLSEYFILNKILAIFILFVQVVDYNNFFRFSTHCYGIYTKYNLNYIKFAYHNQNKSKFIHANQFCSLHKYIQKYFYSKNQYLTDSLSSIILQTIPQSIYILIIHLNRLSCIYFSNQQPIKCWIVIKQQQDNKKRIFQILEEFQNKIKNNEKNIKIRDIQMIQNIDNIITRLSFDCIQLLQFLEQMKAEALDAHSKLLQIQSRLTKFAYLSKQPLPGAADALIFQKLKNSQKMPSKDRYFNFFHWYITMCQFAQKQIEKWIKDTTFLDQDKLINQCLILIQSLKSSTPLKRVDPCIDYIMNIFLKQAVQDSLTLTKNKLLTINSQQIGQDLKISFRPYQERINQYQENPNQLRITFKLRATACEKLKDTISKWPQVKNIQIKKQMKEKKI